MDGSRGRGREGHLDGNTPQLTRREDLTAPRSKKYFRSDRRVVPEQSPATGSLCCFIPGRPHSDWSRLDPRVGNTTGPFVGLGVRRGVEETGRVGWVSPTGDPDTHTTSTPTLSHETLRFLLRTLSRRSLRPSLRRVGTEVPGLLSRPHSPTHSVGGPEELYDPDRGSPGRFVHPSLHTSHLSLRTTTECRATIHNVITS